MEWKFDRCDLIIIFHLRFFVSIWKLFIVHFLSKTAIIVEENSVQENFSAHL